GCGMGGRRDPGRGRLRGGWLRRRRTDKPQGLRVPLHERPVVAPVEAEPGGKLLLVREDDLPVAPHQGSGRSLVRSRARALELAVRDQSGEDRGREHEQQDERDQPALRFFGRLERYGGKRRTRHAAMIASVSPIASLLWKPRRKFGLTQACGEVC